MIKQNKKPKILIELNENINVFDSFSWKRDVSDNDPNNSNDSKL